MANILLAEDDEAMRTFITGALERAGHTIMAHGDGLEALRALKEQSYDLLLTDIVMPGMDGIELSSQASRLYPDMKIVFITGFAAMALEDKDALTGKNRIISKPFHLGKLTAEIEEILKV